MADTDADADERDPAAAAQRREAMRQFDAWLALPDAEQANWLAALAVHDPNAHARVTSLIGADRDAEAASFLHAQPASAGSVRDDAPEPTLAGRRLGPWQIERLIGTGGMGQVWLARRTDGLYEGLAAIKLMRLAATDAGANARFAREGQLLGRLNHPNIARLLDAGVTESGERYLVLEYVDGERIDRYADAHTLTLTQRVSLFIAVCEAVAHAHENLVVHRDLKPSNIFVTASGQVKLLDFGVAKLLADEAGNGGRTGEASELTSSAGAALTPQYASPEQLSGGTVTTATDVYGLGMVLYGLLGGSRPFGDAVLPTPTPTPPRSARPSSLTDAPRPLWALPADLEAAQRIAAARGSSVAALRKALHGDVAVVVGKAIKADAAERYRFVPELADDLRRTLDQRPIAARPDSAAYRARKFMRRHWFGAGAAALIVLAVAGGVAGTLAKQREAEREAQRAVAVKRFLLDLFEQARSAVKTNGTQSREATVNDMLAAGADRIEAAFAAQPEIRDEVFGVLIDLYSETSDQARMTTLARRRLTLARASFGADDRRTVPAEIELAAVHINFGGNAEAKTLLDHAQAMLDRAGDADSLQRALLLRWQGVYVQVNDRTAAWTTHPMRRAVQLFRSRYPDDDNFLEALMAVPALACSSGFADEALAAAEEFHRRALARYGPDTLFATLAVQAHGNLLMMSGRPADAIPMLQQGIAGSRKFVGASSPDVLIGQLQLAQAFFSVGQVAEAQRLFETTQATVQRDHADDARLKRRLAAHLAMIEKIRAGVPLKCGA